jgi:hypothetical protein
MTKINYWVCPECGSHYDAKPSGRTYEKPEIPIPQPEIKPISAVNSMEVAHLIQLWIDNKMPDLSMGDKVEIAVLFSKYPNLEEIFHRWFAYNERFKDILPGKRHEMYLYQNKLSSLVLHIDRFIDEATFGSLFNEHVLRANTFTEKNRSYGFSLDPAEDRKMAIEKERMDISFAVQSRGAYSKGIEFAENIAYYKTKTARVKRGKKPVIHK